MPPETLESQVKAAIVRCLKMPIAPEDITDDTALFGQGLGLDSIDALELVLELQRIFGVVVSDEQMGQARAASVERHRRVHRGARERGVRPVRGPSTAG